MRKIENVDMFGIVKTTKKCIKCGIEKELSEFHKSKKHKDGRRSECKECRNKEQRELYLKPEIKERTKKRSNEYYKIPGIKEKRSIRNKEYYKKPENKEKRSIRNKEYRKKTENREKRNKWQNNKRKIDPVYKMNHIISTGLYQSLKSKGLSKKGRHWENLIGWTQQELKDYITPLFCKKIVDGKEVVMTWENWGTEWHIDHIYPTSLCGATEADVVYNYRLKNLQPLWKEDNIAKHNRLDWVRDPNKYIKINKK